MIKNVAVYCGSSTGKKPDYTKAAVSVGSWLVEHDFGLVYGGASLGLMGTVADTVLAGKGHVCGIMPEILANREIAKPAISEFITVPNMHARKQLMMDKADGFIALPGGCGTMEEIFEVITWSQIGAHEKPFAFYNVAGYYNHLFDFLNVMEDEGFTNPKHRRDILISSSLEEIHQHFMTYQSPGPKDY